MKKAIPAVLIATFLASTVAAVQADTANDLNDLEMAHVAVTANDSDIALGHLALAISSNPRVRTFAETMIRDHSAVNQQVADLAEQLGVMAQDNELSRELRTNATEVVDELSGLRGAEFDMAYMTHEAAYHDVVNGLVQEFIPAIENPRVKQAFQGALEIFLVHQRHAEELESYLTEMN